MELDREMTVFLEKLNGLDFGPLAYKLMHPEAGSGLNLHQATDAITKYKGFLFLCRRNSRKTMSPSLYVDHVWHTHIMDTELYMVQCGLLFGHYLHHNPFFGKKGDEAELEAASADTRSQARQFFGWDDDEWCGTGSPDMMKYFQKHLGVTVDKDFLIRWRFVVTCMPAITREFADLVGTPDVERLGMLQRDLVERRLSPAEYRNEATRLMPSG